MMVVIRGSHGIRVHLFQIIFHFDESDIVCAGKEGKRQKRDGTNELNLHVRAGFLVSVLFLLAVVIVSFDIPQKVGQTRLVV